MHVVVAGMESPLKSALAIFEHNQVEFLLNFGLGVVILQKIGRILPAFGLFQNSVFVQTLYRRDCFGEFRVGRANDLV